MSDSPDRWRTWAHALARLGFLGRSIVAHALVWLWHAIANHPDRTAAIGGAFLAAAFAAERWHRIGQIILLGMLAAGIWLGIERRWGWLALDLLAWLTVLFWIGYRSDKKGPSPEVAAPAQ